MVNIKTSLYYVKNFINNGKYPFFKGINRNKSACPKPEAEHVPKN